MTETIDLKKYDFIYKQMNDRFDIRGSILNEIICSAIENGRVSESIKKHYEKAVPLEAFDFLDEIMKQI